MTVIGGKQDRIHLEYQLQKANCKAARPHSFEERGKLWTDKAIMMAHQHTVNTVFRIGAREIVAPNPPGRIALLIKKAQPWLIKHPMGNRNLRMMALHWEISIRRGGTPILRIYQSQLETLKNAVAMQSER